MDDNQQSSPPSGEQTTRDDGSARQRLIEAATKLFAVNGFDGTSTRDIAKAAELNISLISYYFAGKEGLYKAVIYDFATNMSNQVDQLLQPLELQKLTAETFKSGMRLFIKTMLPMKFKDRDMQLLLQREMMEGLPHAKEVYETVFTKVLENIIGVYKAGQAKGFVRSDVNPYIVFFSMVHATDFYMQMSRCETKIQEKIIKLPENLDEYADQIYKIFVEGVLV